MALQGGRNGDWALPNRVPREIEPSQPGSGISPAQPAPGQTDTGTQHDDKRCLDDKEKTIVKTNWTWSPLGEEA